MKLSNDVEKHEIEVTKIGQNNPLYLTVLLDIDCLLKIGNQITS